MRKASAYKNNSTCISSLPHFLAPTHPEAAFGKDGSRMQIMSFLSRPLQRSQSMSQGYCNLKQSAKSKPALHSAVPPRRWAEQRRKVHFTSHISGTPQPRHIHNCRVSPKNRTKVVHLGFCFANFSLVLMRIFECVYFKSGMTSLW